MEEAQESCKISVIIATRNRAEALKNISLPSLLKQTFKDFEVIVWDASDNEDSAEVVKRFPELEIRYFKAPRVGSCSQRNDAVKEARGEIVYFIDDDSEISPDALEAIYEAMSKGEIVGCSPPVIQKKFTIKEGTNSKFVAFISKIFLLGGFGRSRVILKSGRNQFPLSDKPGTAQWLSGCSMAFYREIFNCLSFDEELQRFGGYALGEDVMFSHKLYQQGELLILSKGQVIHHQAGGGRGNSTNLAAATFFNFFLIWKKTVLPTDKKSIFAFILSIFGSFFLALLVLLFRRNLTPMKGIFLGVKEILNYTFKLKERFKNKNENINLH
ncbi:MAG: glycosyltransferase [Caldiserica bacterium]|jgi:glycosyltransferase involved in cell wall biosynthesis|nr:glycosyltransferase [Caldisericota bacterium]MDH7562180.1 glycosyltransferase [Caldisericota bacterium]